MSKRFTRSSAKPRLVPTQPAAQRADVGWERPPIRAVSMCSACWGSLDHLAWADWCPTCRRIIQRTKEQEA